MRWRGYRFILRSLAGNLVGSQSWMLLTLSKSRQHKCSLKVLIKLESAIVGQWDMRHLVTHFRKNRSWSLEESKLYKTVSKTAGIGVFLSCVNATVASPSLATCPLWVEVEKYLPTAWVNFNMSILKECDSQNVPTWVTKIWKVRKFIADLVIH